METKKGNPKEGLKRRNFLKLGGMSLLSLPFLVKAKLTFAEPPPDPRDYWEGLEGAEYCVSRVVKSENIRAGFIWARIDKVWRRFPIREVEQKFLDWEFTERIARYENQKAGGGISAAGPHTPAVATYGNRMGRGDSDFHINCKFIGLTNVPKKESIKEINNTMLANIDIPFTEKLDYLIEITSNRDLWRKDLHAGLELFSTPEFMTHTFYNLMQNPVATLCFQGAVNIFTSFELRCIAKIVHPQDPNLSEEERDINIFPAILHGYFHAFYPEQVNEPGVIFYHVEEFDNSPGPKGIRLVSTIKERVKSLIS
jgi:hypothetical protein